MRGSSTVSIFSRKMNLLPRHILHLVGFLTLILCSSQKSGAQNILPKIRFVQSDNAQFGFDGYKVVQWKKRYRTQFTHDSIPFQVARKSMLNGSIDHVQLVIDKSIDSLPKLTFLINDSLMSLNYSHISRDTIQLQLPAMQKDFVLQVFRKNKLQSELDVIVFEERSFNVKIVPLVKKAVNRDSLLHYLNNVYAQAGVSIDLTIDEYFSMDTEFDTIFANPSKDHDRYTDQMIEVRDAYFDLRGKDNKTYYIFLVADFVSDEFAGYMVRNKAVGFLEHNEVGMYRELAHQLGYGIGGLDDIWKDKGPDRGTTKNLMDTKGIELNYWQWEQIRSNGWSVSYYDDYENVHTNNGLIAYYMWEELPDGTIKFTGSEARSGINRPYKKNTYSLHLNIDNFLFYHLFEVLEYPICLLHILAFIAMMVSTFFVRRYTVRKIAFIQRRRIFRFATRVSSFSLHLWFFYLLFLLVNEGYYLFEVDNGKLDYLSGMSYRNTRKEIWSNNNIRRNEEDKLGSEVLIKRKGEWYLEKKKPVLYFNVSKKDGKETIRFHKDSDELKLQTLKFRKKSNSHYFVLRYLDANGKLASEKAYNHIGVNITDKLNLEDPAERILLFVNGYRPTSTGDSFEDNFTDIQSKGLEFSNSMNLIYDFDRFDYWNRWNEFDTRFQKRLNPTKTLYADGHHSVSTSNHESLIEFTKISLSYPKRCKNPRHHVCKKSEKGFKWLGIGSKVPTYETQHLDPNEDGFNLRLNNGKIAGRNMYQILNEIPSRSSNDTLYIVAHSMGYAYALGIIEKLRGKINFGGFYIIAPENAVSGELNQGEWNEVWQYGSDFEAHKLSAPCLLDGIAPQTKAGGLSPRKRAYIPEELYTKMGFFQSHFIGNYTWIFDIDANSPGYVRQR